MKLSGAETKVNSAFDSCSETFEKNVPYLTVMKYFYLTGRWRLIGTQMNIRTLHT